MKSETYQRYKLSDKQVGSIEFFVRSTNKIVETLRVGTLEITFRKDGTYTARDFKSGKVIVPKPVNTKW